MSDPAAITVFTARRIITMDESLPEATAIAVRGERIVEVGTHAELMERHGFFYKLVRTQQETTGVMAVNG